MSILIVSATEFEIKPSLKFFKKHQLPVLITGVGAGAAIYAITKAIEKYKPSLILQAGIGGSMDRQINIGDVVVVAQDFFGDLGVMENKQWRSLLDLGFMKPNQKPFKNGILANPNKRAIHQSGLGMVRAVTVNEITTSKSRIKMYKDQGVSIETMEGAALHYVALMEGIPFLQIRSISNAVGERDKSKWDIVGAIQKLNAVMMKLDFWRNKGFENSGRI
ncbi:MAG TPA: futalosine hydrolase [Niabella sp.]|nr:futalosine hydrolase [Niabella sp.]HOZ97384.1 futalosine hydrolase [Niabella sp.]HQW15248.1 futalosine hydrolase [Niabella sp.]HQX20284.1 futalosine hydrolase [Niabella sp.]HQX42427.1 futalosine hydrolase [Niabella sp.]